ncbi:hypothetical protein DM01DRAFT_1331769 [Hesseltinella vesiculosa]|uniref:Uncharacterized protein n=1 Tax=Hesseltinella vesiculosa TaxID=101127 RepID=A0A1X2GWE9_9FUNG|nr:hypothetical protein DM01DRAFT_1331769 [Hesseltinella vesiculosa]
MSSRRLSRLVNSSIENFITRQNAETSYSNLVDMPDGEIVRRFIVLLFDVSGFEFYLKLIHDQKVDFQQQIPGKCGNAGYA